MTVMHRNPTLQLLAFSLASSMVATAQVVYDGKIRDEGNGLMSAYMIPVSNDNHAATLEQLPDGSLVAAWFGGESEEASNVAIAVSRLTNGSDAWTNRTIVAQRDGYANGNPLLFFDATTSTLHLWHTQVKAGAGEGDAKIYRLKSTDGGVTWSDEGQYFDKEGIYIRNRIIRRKDGTLLWPYYTTESSAAHNIGPTRPQHSRAPVFAWSKSNSVPTSGSGWSTKIMNEGDATLEQPTCWRQPRDESTIECYFRDHGDAKWIYAAESKNEGESFSVPKPTKLPNPDSGIEGFPLQGANVVLLFNPTTKTDKSRGRDPLAVGISTDDGKTWKQRDVQNGPTGVPSLGDNQFSYPTVLQTSDGMIHAMYTYAPDHQETQPRTIKYVRFTESWVMQK
jgi:predicted neuraminidase